MNMRASLAFLASVVLFWVILYVAGGGRCRHCAHNRSEGERLISNRREFDCLVVLSNPFTSRSPAEKILLKCQTHLLEGLLLKLKTS